MTIETALRFMLGLLIFVLIIGVPFAIGCAIVLQLWRWLM